MLTLFEHIVLYNNSETNKQLISKTRGPSKVGQGGETHEYAHEVLAITVLSPDCISPIRLDYRDLDP